MVARGIADVEGGKIKDIREHLHMETNEFNPYRKRLIKKGILSGATRGYVLSLIHLFESGKEYRGSKPTEYAARNEEESKGYVTIV